MSGAATSKARWIILPTIRDREAWRAAITAGAQSAGLHLVDWDVTRPMNGQDDPATIILTKDADAAAAAGADPQHTTVVLGAGEPDIEAIPAAADRNALLLHLTQPLARAEAFAGARVIGRRDLNGAPIEMAPGLNVAPPTPAASSDLAQNLALYGRADAVVTWGPSFFTYDPRNADQGPKTGEMDLTGRPRFLIHGPYIVMPPGRWKAIFRLGFDRPGSRVRFRLDWGGQTEYDSEEFTPGRPGLFEIEMDYVWREPAPAEFRILVMEGVFDGQLTFGGVKVSRMSDV